MKIRNTVILFGIFALALLIFAAFQWLGIKTGDESKHAERYVFPSLNPYNPKKDAQVQDPNAPPAKTTGLKAAEPEEFTRIVIDRFQGDAKKHERLEFNRITVGKGSKWALVSPVKVRTDDAAVTALIRSLISLEKQKSRESSRDLSTLGLDKPDTVVTLTRGGKDYTLNLGSTGPATKDPVYFASSSDWASKPFMLNKSKVDKLFDEINNFRDKALVSNSFGHTDVKLGGTARTPLELSKEKEWTIKNPALGEADLAATDELTRQLSGIKVERNEDYVADNADDAKLTQYGLADDKAPYTYTITQSPIAPTDPATVEKVLVGNADDSAAKQAATARTAALIIESLTAPTASLAAYVAREKQKTEPTHYYARLAGDKTIVRISAKHLPLLKKTADELRTKSIAKLDNSKVDAVTLNTQGETMRIYRPDLKGAASWDLYTDNRARVKSQPQAIQNLLDAVSKIQLSDSKSFLDDDAKLKAWFGTKPIDLGLDKPQAELSIWQDGILRDKDGKPEGNAEPKLQVGLDKKPSIKLYIGRKDDERKVVYVRREVPGQQPVVLAVPDPFISGQSVGATQAGAVPPDGRQTFSLSSLTSQGYLAYRDRSLPSYRVDQVASVEVKRPGATYLMDKTDGKDEHGMLTTSWKLKQPVEGPTNTGVADYMLNTIASTSSQNLITDRANDKDLDEVFGLKSPQFQVTVKTKGSEKPTTPESKDAPKPVQAGTYTYMIGKKLGDTSRYPNHYYARVETKLADGTTPDSNQFVIAVPANYVQSLDLELRDGIIFPETTARPVSLSLTWNGETTDKKPLKTEMELALVNEKWEVKKLTENGTDAKTKLARLDQGKVSALLRYGPQPAPGGPSLNPLSVDRFWQHTGAIDPKLRLDPAKADLPPRLVIEVKYADSKSRTLILGDTLKPSETLMPFWKDATFYYVATPSMPGVVALVNELTWRELVSGSTYFAEKAKTSP